MVLEETMSPNKNQDILYYKYRYLVDLSQTGVNYLHQIPKTVPGNLNLSLFESAGLYSNIFMLHTETLST